MAGSSFVVSPGWTRATRPPLAIARSAATARLIAWWRKAAGRSLGGAAPVLECAAPTVSETGPKNPPTGDVRTGDPRDRPDEFAGIPSRPSRHPAIAAAAVALAGFLIFQIRDDVKYALSPTVPIELGDVRSALASSGLPSNRYVRLAGHADRESALVLDAQGAWNFNQFFRLLGTDDRVFVERAPDPLPVELADHDAFTGRLVPFHDLSFQESIRRHFSAHVSATHFFAPAALEAVLGKGGPVALTDRLGQKVTLAPDDLLSIDTARAGDLRVELPGNRYPELARAKAAVAAQGGEVLSGETTDTRRQAVIARFPEAGRAAAMAALSDLDRSVRIEPARTTTRVRLADLRVSPEGLVARTPAGEITLPRAEIQTMRSISPVRIPDGAWLLTEGDRPRDHLRSVVIAIFLVGFAMFNLLALKPRRA
jgi:hypothetical protein